MLALPPSGVTDIPEQSYGGRVSDLTTLPLWSRTPKPVVVPTSRSPLGIITALGPTSTLRPLVGTDFTVGDPVGDKTMVWTLFCCPATTNCEPRAEMLTEPAVTGVTTPWRKMSTRSSVPPAAQLTAATPRPPFLANATPKGSGIPGQRKLSKRTGGAVVLR